MDASGAIMHGLVTNQPVPLLFLCFFVGTVGLTDGCIGGHYGGPCDQPVRPWL